MKKKRLIFLFIALAVICVLDAYPTLGGEIIAVKSKDVTSKDIPLEFTLEKTTWEYSKVSIWGTVKNSSKKKYISVQVIFTARDSNNNFLGRDKWYTDPCDINPGQVGYMIGQYVECEGRKPSILEFSVIGEKE